MNRRFVSIIIFTISSLTLLISLKLFFNMAIFADEYGLSPGDVTGSDFWLSMDWLRLLLLFILCIISAANIFSNKRGKK